MNNNRNNRRRGRGNRNQGGGGNNGNRIDSRARGNAPQLLDKYKKLAQDAQHNGDRVQAEYYLQFADHYFRVIADNKARQDEARGTRRDDDRPMQDDDGEDGDFEFDGDDRRMSRPARPRREDAPEAEERQAQRPRRTRSRDDGPAAGDDQDAAANPFLATPDAAPRPRRTARKPRRSEQGQAGVEGEIDLAALPPAIGPGDGEGARPAPRNRRRKQDDDAEVGAVG